MALTKIQYTNKETLNAQPSIADKNKVTSGDMNEIKSVVNDAIDQVDTNTNDISTNAGNISTNTTDITNLKKNVTYSTTEQVIGKWINNKPIYRKVFEINSQTLPNNKWLYIDHNLGVATYINFWGFVSSGTNTQPIPRPVTDAVANWSIGSGDFTTNRVGIQFGTNYSSVDSGFIVLEYTKTND